MQGLFMHAAAEPSPADREIGRPRIVTSGELFGGESEVLIMHNGVQYRLRITRQDKLILTK
jgi:hemin uptake protein HemP